MCTLGIMASLEVLSREIEGFASKVRSFEEDVLVLSSNTSLNQGKQANRKLPFPPNSF